MVSLMVNINLLTIWVLQNTLFITTKGAKRLKKHSNVDYGAAKLIETEKCYTVNWMKKLDL